MLDLTATPDDFLDPVARVIKAALAVTNHLSPEEVMVVGAWCRDILHSALGHDFATTATRDLDLALALSSWDSYRAIAGAFPSVGDTGIRFRIADVDVDLLPFGDIEDPQGIVDPPYRGEALSVWAFEEIFVASLPLALSPTTTIHIPTVAGYAAAKLGAWLDRSDWLETKDAADLALILHWYAESADIHNRLYETPIGNEIVIVEGADVPLAAAHLLGTDIAATIGPARLTELLARWPGDAELLVRELVLRGGPAWPRDPQRRRTLLDALTRGLAGAAS
jgi:predicted nucleotidyltransferase